LLLLLLLLLWLLWPLRASAGAGRGGLLLGAAAAAGGEEDRGVTCTLRHSQHIWPLLPLTCSGFVCVRGGGWMSEHVDEHGVGLLVASRCQEHTHRHTHIHY
jgi:hypothetical protein